MTAAADPVVICSFARTPMGGFQGALSPVKATDLGAAAVKAAVERAGVAPEKVEQIFMGCVLPAGLGQAPARQAAIGAGLGKHVEATTVNKMCGSGLQSAMMAHDALLAGTADVIVAGGMESMTGAPYLMNKHRGGARIGHDVIVDSMMMDGLEDAYSPGKAMGVFAEDAAAQYQFTREQMDEYAIESLTRAKNAIASGAFKAEIVPVEVATRKGPVTVSEDEQPGKADAAKIPTLKPAFVHHCTSHPKPCPTRPIPPTPLHSPGFGWAALACGPRRGGRPGLPGWGSSQSAAPPACPAPPCSGRCSAPRALGSAPGGTSTAPRSPPAGCP